MVDYTSLRLTAERLINENGRTLTLQREDQTNFAVTAEPWRTADPAGANVVSLTVLGVFSEFEKEDFDGSLIRRGDKQVLIAAKDLEDVQSGSENIKIEDFDTLLDGTEIWKIITAVVIEPGSLRVMFDLQVRK